MGRQHGVMGAVAAVGLIAVLAQVEL